MDIEQIKADIKRLGLDRKCRKRNIIYQRAYLYKYLSMYGMNQEHYAPWFGVERSTVSHSINHVYDAFKEDKYYNMVVSELIDLYPLPVAGVNAFLSQIAVYKADFEWLEQKRNELGKQKKADVVRMLINHYESK